MRIQSDISDIRNTSATNTDGFTYLRFEFNLILSFELNMVLLFTLEADGNEYGRC